MDAGCSNIGDFTNTEIGSRRPAWSPDGKKFTFLHGSHEVVTGWLYMMNADGNAPKEILRAEIPVESGRPAWRPK